jgi:hypothetical protein
MPPVRFEPITPVFVKAKTVLALDRAAAVVGTGNIFSIPVTGRGGL